MKRTLKAIPVGVLLLAGATTEGFAATDGWAPRESKEPTTRGGVTGGNCAGLSEISYKTAERFNPTVAFFNFVNIPNSGVSFSQGTAGCVVVTFSAEAWAPGNRILELRARLDSSNVAEPRLIQLSGDDDEWAGARSFTFVFPNVSAGAHSVNFQFRNGLNGSGVFIGDSTSIVQHR